MPFMLSDADALDTTVIPSQSLSRSIIDSFQQILIKFGHFILLSVCVVLSLMVTSSFNQFLLAVPIFLLVYSIIIHVLYARLMSSNFDEINTSWYIELALVLFIHYTKYVGNLLGGTQWLIIVLRLFGAHIGDDFFINNMNSLYDVHLITIGSHSRLSSTCQIQVESLVEYFVDLLFFSK